MSSVSRVASCAVAVLALASCGSTSPSAAEAEVTTAPPEPTAFERVLEVCEVPAGALGDDGGTLTLDGAGKDDRFLRDGSVETKAGKLAADDLWCALDQIGASDAVIARMEATRALDGMKEFDEDGFTYVWTYHPDAGLDIIVTESAA